MYPSRPLPAFFLLLSLVLASPLSPRSQHADVFHTVSPERNTEALTRVAYVAPSHALASAATPTADGGSSASGGWVRTPVAPTLHVRSVPSPAAGIWRDLPPRATGRPNSSSVVPEPMSFLLSPRALPKGGTSPRSGSQAAVSSVSAKAYTDIQLLNIALDLQYLLQGFHSHLSRSCDSRAFANAGYPSSVRNRFIQIQTMGEVHIGALVDAVAEAGGQPVQRGCRYNFRETSVVGLIALAETLETAAVSTHRGILPLLESKVCVKVIADVMAMHARAAAWVNAAVRSSSAWNTAFEPSLSVDLLINLVDSYTVRSTCPKANAALLPISISTSVSVSSDLTLPASITAGATVAVSLSLDYSRTSILDLSNLYLAFMVGEEIYYQPLLNSGSNRVGHCDGEVVVPVECNAKGYVYVLAVQGKNGVDIASVDLQAQLVIGGPWLREFPFDSEGRSSVEVAVDVALGLGLAA